MSDTNTKALLHFNGDNNAVYLDDFGSAKVWTANGTAKISTAVKKLGRGSLYLDGDTGYISTPDHDDFTLGATTDKFSFDFWIYLPTLPASTPSCIFSKVQDASNKYFLELYDNAGVATMRFRVREGGVYINDFEWALVGLAVNTWEHFELTQSAGTMYLYRGGGLISSQAGFSECSNTTGAFEIGRNATINYLSAYMDEFRYSKGIARHTGASFTLEASGYRRAGVDDEYTAFLLHPAGTSGAISADAVGAVLTDYRHGASQATAEVAQYKFLPSSAYCNGTTASKGLSAGGGTLPRVKISYRTYATIDFWVRFTSVAAVQNFYGIASSTMPSLRYDGTGANKRFGIYTTYLNITNALAIDTWYHIAFVKNASNITVYVNGVSQGTLAIGTAWDSYDTLAEAAAIVYQIMADYNGACTAYFDEFRISPDIQRWTADFTPETAEYGAQIIEADFTETLTITQTAQTTWDNETSLAGISDAMEVLREVPYDETPLTALSDTMAIEREAHFYPEDQVGISDAMSLILELDVSDAANSHTMGVSDLFTAEVQITEPGIDLLVPPLTFAGTLRQDARGQLSISLPALAAALLGGLHPVGVLDITLPRLHLGLSATANESGVLSFSLPRLMFSGECAVGASGTLDVTLPMLRPVITGHLSASGVLTITLPLMRLSLQAEPHDYVALVLNLHNYALTQYDTYNFNSLCQFNGVTLGAMATKICNLDSGTTDDGTIFDWNIRTPYIDMEQKFKKRLIQAWLSYKSDGDIIVTVVQPDGMEYEYPLDGLSATEEGVRVKFGKGIRSKYLALDIKSVDGSTLTLDALRLHLDKINKER